MIGSEIFIKSQHEDLNVIIDSFLYRGYQQISCVAKLYNICTWNIAYSYNHWITRKTKNWSRRNLNNHKIGYIAIKKNLKLGLSSQGLLLGSCFIESGIMLKTIKEVCLGRKTIFHGRWNSLIKEYRFWSKTGLSESPNSKTYLLCDSEQVSLPLNLNLFTYGIKVSIITVLGN